MDSYAPESLRERTQKAFDKRVHLAGERVGRYIADAVADGCCYVEIDIGQDEKPFYRVLVRQYREKGFAVKIVKKCWARSTTGEPLYKNYFRISWCKSETNSLWQRLKNWISQRLSRKPTAKPSAGNAK